MKVRDIEEDREMAGYEDRLLFLEGRGFRRPALKARCSNLAIYPWPSILLSVQPQIAVILTRAVTHRLDVQIRSALAFDLSLP